jgi:hypothetical protein
MKKEVMTLIPILRKVDIEETGGVEFCAEPQDF